MASLRFFWDDDTLRKLADRGLTQDEVEAVVCDPYDDDVSRATGRPCVFGWTVTGRFIIVIYEEVGPDEVQVMTAYDVPEP
jgi:uncharacterized DUF497 family protein